MKKVNMLGVAITPSIIYSNISLVFVSKGLEMSEIENPWLISFISFFSLSLIFYSTSFINLYKKDVNKYKDNINLYIQDCVNFFLTMAPLGQGVGGPAYTAYVFFFESLGVNQTLNLMISNTLRSFLLVPIVIPFFLFTDKIKSKFNKLKK
ncbi:MAG: hypothetical protein HRU03_05095 [Nanoarchaeales archaeon]|nr:hypothetical protein [Nanoarchaeales archaeon]